MSIIDTHAQGTVLLLHSTTLLVHSDSDLIMIPAGKIAVDGLKLLGTLMAGFSCVFA